MKRKRLTIEKKIQLAKWLIDGFKTEPTKFQKEIQKYLIHEFRKSYK